MSTLVTRAGKGSPLTHNEVDANFTNLNTDKIQSGNTVAALTITALTTPSVQAVNSAGLALKNSAGTTQMSMGAGGGDNLTINVSSNLNGTNAQIDISPTGTGHVHINPSGSGSIEMNPTSVGTIDNMTIGATTAKNGSFVNLSVTGTTSFDGSQGTAGQVLTSAGTGNTPTWTTIDALPSQTGNSGKYLTTNGSAASWGTVSSGAIIQLVQATYSTQTSNSTTTYADSGLTGTITPTSASSKVLITIAGLGYKGNANVSNSISLKVQKNGSDLITFTDLLLYTATATENSGMFVFNYLDSPATTSATTYKLQFKNSFVNASNATVQFNNMPSTITLTEIAG